jgi:hypothetical protein
MTPTDHAEANHLALICLAKWFAPFSADSCDKRLAFLALTRSESSKPSEAEKMLM